MILFFVVGSHHGWLVGEYCAGIRTLTPLEGMVVSRSVCMVRHPRGSYIAYPLLPRGVATPENKSSHSTLSSTCNNVRTGCQGTHHPAVHTILLYLNIYNDEAHPSFMRLAEHLTALLAWCNVCVAGESPTCSVPAL